MLNIFEKLNLIKTSNSIINKPIEYVIVGLGNPGNAYANTRHNIGFIALDYIAEKFNVNIDKNKFQSLYTDVVIEDKRLILLKPQTFMNNSGIAVQEVMNFYKIPIEKVVVLTDDISLPIGKIRIRQKGSSGGQNGLKDIIKLCCDGENNIKRIRIGIGKKPNNNWELKDWVLSKFTNEEQIKLKECIDNVLKSICLIINNNIDKAMNLYN